MFVLTRGLPHRVQDLTAGNVGDNPTPAWSRTNAGQSTDASVDSERTRLWQDLDLFAQVVVSPLDDHSPLIKIVADAGHLVTVEKPGKVVDAIANLVNVG